MQSSDGERTEVSRRGVIASLGAAGASLLGVGSLGATSAAASTSGITTGQTYKLLNVANSKAADVADFSTADGRNVHQWGYVGGANQQWTVEAAADGYYKLLNENSGKALDVSAASTEDGATVQQWSYVGGQNQQWAIEETGAGVYRLTARHSGKALEIPGFAQSIGDDVQQWGDGGGANQRWVLLPVGGDSTPNVTLANDNRYESDGVGYVELDVTNEESTAVAVNPTVEETNSGDVFNPDQTDIVLRAGETKRITVSFTGYQDAGNINLYVGDETLVLQQVPYTSFP